jgi:PAS domain S-box-containing protein
MGNSFYSNEDLYFLSGGGEMGELIRKMNWEKTPLGNPNQWPQSLKTAVSIMINNPFGMYIAWGDEYIQLYNDGYRPILGLTKHPQALGISSRETFAEIWDIIGAMFDDVMTGKAVGFPDFMLPLNRNGYIEECYFDFSYSPIKKKNGEVGGVLVTVIETTNKKKIEDALKESEERFRTMADNIPNLAWMASPNGDIFWYNKRWYEYTGSTYEDMKGWGWQSIHNPNNLDAVMEKWEVSIDKEIPFEMTFPLKGADGLYREFLTRVIPIFDTNNKLSQWFGTNTDITEEVLAQRAAEVSGNNLHMTIMQAPTAMAVLRGSDYIVEIVNDLALAIWGRTRDEVIKKPILESMPELESQGIKGLLDDVFINKNSFSASEMPVNIIRNANLETVYINFVYEPLLDIDGNVFGIVAVGHEVTQQVHTRLKIEEIVHKRTADLEDANNSLKKSNAELEQFAYIASHDLQEPVRKICTFSEMIEHAIDNNESLSAKKYIVKIQNSAHRMTKLIRDVLAYSEINKINRNIETVNLEEIIDDVLSDFELLIQNKKATIYYSNLPIINARPLHMQQLFGNLIGNSLKFARKDVDLILEISCSIPDELEKKQNNLEPLFNYIKIIFTDNGIGFQEEHDEQIFNIFQRLHSKSQYDGTGIGLALCKKIVLDHKGNMNAKGSTLNKAVFNVYLPIDSF